MNFKISWWQLFIYEVAVLCLGIFVGVQWHDFFSDYLYFLLFVFVVFSVYVVYFLVNQTEM
ncbi:MAG: hypothetical protein U9P61_02805 [Patescibacteria group bacterium]|nr:hypothetical protein [Patescibacteria group bacterium]